MSKITVNRNHKSSNRAQPGFIKVIPDAALQKLISTDERIFNVSNKVTSIASIYVFIIISGDTFLCTLQKSE